MNAAEICSTLTRRSRSNFYYAFLCLPKAQREAIYAVYAFCRIVDDIVDLGGDPAVQRSELERWRREIARCYETNAELAGEIEDPVARRLAQVVRDFPVPREALEEIIAGVEMDLDRTTYETFDDLYPYCYRVAGAVGLCCIEIFGYTDPRAREYAVNLGIALQMTNILRDLRSDLERGRIYLPLEDLRRFGVTPEALMLGEHTDAFTGLMRFEAQRARGFYRRAAETFPKADSRRLLAAVIMGQIYYALLESIEARGFRVFDSRVTVPVSTKVAIALRCWAGARLGAAA